MNIIDGENVWIVLCSKCSVVCCTNSPVYADKRVVEHKDAHGSDHRTYSESIAFTVVG